MKRLFLGGAILFAAALATFVISVDVSGQEEEEPVLDLSSAAGGAPQAPDTDSQAAGDPSAAISVARSQVPGKSCTTINFEGLGNGSSIPEFDGITSPGWLALIDFDAGGTGNFAFEPSPSTIAFWLGDPPGSRVINFAKPASDISFFYTSFVDITLEAFDADGNSVAKATAPANWNEGPGGDPNGTFNKWDPLGVQTDENVIKSARVSGNVNQTGIDDLTVCRSLRIHSVEITQAIQVWQTLDELMDDLEDDGAPPVPIVALKPTALRVYLDEVDTVTEVRVQLRIPGLIRDKTITLQPGCTPEEIRKQQNKCLSVDFIFGTPEGSWFATVKLFDSDDNEIQSLEFTLTSRTSRALKLVPVSVCRLIPIPPFPTECEDGKHLERFLPMLRASAPTHRVQTIGETRTVTVPGGLIGNVWWVKVLLAINGLWVVHGPSDSYYHGMVRNDAPGDILGMALLRGAASRVESLVPGTFGFENTAATVVHETGHMLGRPHTNTEIPDDKCSLGSDPFADWPYPDNRIQEVGFDVANRKALDPENTFDWMSYCLPPYWISPHTYTNVMETLRETAEPLVSIQSQPVQFFFWHLSGVFEDGGLILEPLFTFEAKALVEPGEGSHRIEVLDAAGTILFTRFFDPITVSTRTFGEEVKADVFSELVPVQNGAASIVIRNPDGDALANLALGGTPPTVTIIFPSGGEALEGEEELAWQVTDPDSPSHVFRVEYSPDGSTTQHILATDIEETRIVANFDDLPGCSNGCVIRVLASDGVNTGIGISHNFNVPSKVPLADILFPGDGTTFQTQQLVWLQGHGFDPDDGFLTGAALNWESNLDGFLGSGDDLQVSDLSEGAHVITFTATDTEGNTASDAVTIHVDGSRPAIDLIVVPDGVPSRCVEVTIDATDEAGGSGLASVEYSLNAGETWNLVSRDDLPFEFTVPGHGFIHLVARAIDRAGNLAAADRKFFIEQECGPGNTPPTADAGVDQNVECATSAGTVVFLNGTGSSDADGDRLTFGWSAPGVTFDDASSSTPTATFPLGTTNATLIVNDGLVDSAPDTVDITVQDTSPPSVSAQWVPLDVEEDEGKFILEFSATDVCDSAPQITGVLETPSLDGLKIKLKTGSKVRIEFDLEDGKVKIEGPDPKALLAQLKVFGGLSVESGQLVKIEIEEADEGELEFEFGSGGTLKIKGASATLMVTGEDVSGNIATVQVSPQFAAEEDDDEDKNGEEDEKHDDHEDEEKVD